MKAVLFNRNPALAGKVIEQPAQDLVKNTLSLWNASLDDALKYGGDLTRAALGAMNIRHDRKYVVVDTKIHMLMPGFCPAIPGWHTDGVPRGPERNPAGKGKPDIFAQEDGSIRPHRFHLMVTGTGCLTDFMEKSLVVGVPDDPDESLYKVVSEKVQELRQKKDLGIFTINPCQVYEWDWWNLHSAVKATKHEWRFLIRVCETDYYAPQTDLRSIIRTQQNVYVPELFGW